MSILRFKYFYSSYLFITLTVSISSFASPELYVGNFIDNSVSVIDTTTNKVTHTIPVGPGPAGMSITPDNRYVYVADSGTYTMSVIDTTLKRVVSHVEVGKIPQGMAMQRNGKVIIVAILGTNSIVYVDTKSNEAIVKFLVGKVNDVVLNAANNLAFAGLQEPGQYAIAVIDIAKHTITQSISLQKPPLFLTVNPGNQNIYFTMDDTPAVQVLDDKTYQIIKQIPVGSSPSAIAFTQDGKLGLVVCKNDSMLYIFDAITSQVIDKIAVGKQPYDVVVASKNKMAYVSNELSNDVSVVDLVNRKIIATIPVGSTPHRMVMKR